jgi:hypothetical protein
MWNTSPRRRGLVDLDRLDGDSADAMGNEPERLPRFVEKRIEAHHTFEVLVDGARLEAG